MRDTITVVKVSQTWCKPCRVFIKTFEKARQDLGFEAEYVDADEQKELVDSWGVDQWPTTVILKNGEVVDTLTGAVRVSVLKEFISKHMEDE